MLFPVITLDRLIFLTLFLGFALFQLTRRNVQTLKATPIVGGLVALVEVVLQAAILLGVLLGLNTLVLLVFEPGRFLGFIILILTCLIAYRPVKAVTSWIEQKLAGEQ